LLGRRSASGFERARFELDIGVHDRIGWRVIPWDVVRARDALIPAEHHFFSSIGDVRDEVQDAARASSHPARARRS
jgi:hypothetical protein